MALIAGQGAGEMDEKRVYNTNVESQIVLDTPARDVLHFDLQDGEVTGLTLNPGPWEQSATRLE